MNPEKTYDSSVLRAEDWTELEGLYGKTLEYTGEFYEMRGGDRNPDGSVNMPHTEPAPVVLEVMQFFYDKDLVVPFDWPHWEEGRALFRREGESKFDDVSFEDALKLFTAIIRNDRFNDGAFAAIFESGDAQLLLKRLLSFKP